MAMVSVYTNNFVNSTDGTRIYFKEVGEGSPVLLVPGAGSATWTFNSQVKHLSRLARVLALDNRGSGRSGKPPGPYSIDTLAEDTLAVLQAAKAGPAHIVGTSMGGYIAQTLALRHPEAVRSLTLIASAGGGPRTVGLPAETLQAWTRSIHLSPAAYARATMPYSFAPGWVDEHPDEYERLLALRLTSLTPADAWQAQLGACARFLAVGPPSGTINVPTLVVHGTADRVVPYGNAAPLVQRIPRARLVTLDGAGHLCWLERPEVVNNLLSGVVAGSELTQK